MLTRRSIAGVHATCAATGPSSMGPWIGQQTRMGGAGWDVDEPTVDLHSKYKDVFSAGPAWQVF